MQRVGTGQVPLVGGGYPGLSGDVGTPLSEDFVILGTRKRLHPTRRAVCGRPPAPVRIFRAWRYRSLLYGSAAACVKRTVVECAVLLGTPVRIRILDRVEGHARVLAALAALADVGTGVDQQARPLPAVRDRDVAVDTLRITIGRVEVPVAVGNVGYTD